MNRWLLRSAALAAVLMVSATAAYAAGSLNMAWSNCVGEGTPATNKAFACGVTTGTNTLVCSFIAPAGLHKFNGAEGYIDIITQTSPLPAWWAMYNPMSDGTATCRTALSANVTMNGAYIVCQDVWAGIGLGGVAAYANPIVALPNIGANSTHYATIDVAGAVAAGSEQDLTPGAEYFLFNVNISNTKSTGTGSCAGCADPTCLSFTRLDITEPPGIGDFHISTPGVVSLVTWQGVGANCTAVPVRKATWGAIKSMYR